MLRDADGQIAAAAEVAEFGDFGVDFGGFHAAIFAVFGDGVEFPDDERIAHERAGWTDGPGERLGAIVLDAGVEDVHLAEFHQPAEATGGQWLGGGMNVRRPHPKLVADGDRVGGHLADVRIGAFVGAGAEASVGECDFHGKSE